METISLYIHIPFCQKKCAYCDFLSFEKVKGEDKTVYVDYLLKELEAYSNILEGRVIDTIFFGGGSPSLLSVDLLNRILNEIKKFTLSEDCEISLEANPESFLQLEAKALHKNGFNRLSLGIQSASDRLLKTIGRIHTAKQGKEAFFHGRKAGFSNINVDFISSVPGETVNDIEETLTWIKETEPDHVSLYSLIIEEKTPLYQWVKEGRLKTLSEEEDRKHVHLYKEGLEKLSYRQYEISNFAKEAYQCRHNRSYWTLKEYIGLGLGAHSNLGNMRWYNQKDLDSYYDLLDRKTLPILQKETLSPLDRTNEYTMLGIRLNEGIDPKKILPNGEVFCQFYSQELEENRQKGLILWEEDRIFLSPKGQDLCNLVETSFFQLS